MYHVLILLLMPSAISTALELTYEIFEEQASKTFIGNVARDLSLHEIVSNVTNLKFSLLTNGNQDSLFFIIDEADGDLLTSQLIDRESICSFLVKCELNFEIAVQSFLGSFFRKVSVSVTILDINDNAPQFSPDKFQLMISEGSGTGTTFPVVKAIDQDADVNNSVHSYSLFTNTNIFSLVAIKDFVGGFNDVSLKLEQKLDREIQSEYHLTVIAEDSANPPKTGTLLLTVLVEDINDNAPEFEQRSYSFNVSESLPVNGLILKLNVSDKDQGDNADISFYFTPRQPERVLKPFTLDQHTGELRTVQTLNTSVGEVFELLAEARDHGSPTMTTQVLISIRVLDTHNNPPIININVFSSSGSAEVSESSTIGRAVAHIGVNDPDSGLNGIVNCTITHEYVTLSRLDVNEYKAILSKRLDRELFSQHVAQVVCYDAGNPSLTTTTEFTIKVLDENDNSPVFSQSRYYVSIVENNFIGQFIAKVSAVDYDVGPNAKIAYGLDGEHSHNFQISTNGTVVAVKQLDRELTPLIRLQVTATDNGLARKTSTALVEITVGDLNDKRPQFNKTVYYFSVFENLLPGNDVGLIDAFDKDLHENARIVFSLAKSNDADLPFTCSANGLIETTRSLDRETKNRYRLTVVATDKGDPPLSTSVEVVVMVNDLNDQSPIILYPNNVNNTVSIPNSIGANTGFSAILAYDLDKGVNSRLEYHLKDDNNSEYFTVDPVNGEVLTKKAFSAQEKGIYHLKLIAQDQGIPIRKTIADLYVEVYIDDIGHEKSSILSKHNIIAVSVIVCITVILGVCVGIIIIFLRRRDKQKRIYNAKREESRVIANMKQYETANTDSGEWNAGLDSQCTSSDSTSYGKKKEVSFSLADGNNLTSDSDGGSKSANKVDKTLFNQLSEEQLIFKKLRNTGGKVEPPFTGLSQYLYHQKATQSINEKDSGSVTSGELSASDSGRGGSDIDVTSHTVSHESAEMFFPPTRSILRNSTKRPAPINPDQRFYDELGYGLSNNSSDVDRLNNCTIIPSSEHLQMIKQQRRNNVSNSSSARGSGHFQSRSVPGRYGVKPEVTRDAKKQNDNNQSIYVEMRTPMSSSFASSSVCDDSKCDALWGDNDTSTTSGSYTVDADELCQEIDKLFFKENNVIDIIV